jgi:hypothetical protein
VTDLRDVHGELLRMRMGRHQGDELDVHGELLWMRPFKPDPLPRGWRLERDGLDGATYAEDTGLFAILSGSREDDGRRWLHLSVSRPSRMPTWDDLKRARAALLGEERYAYVVFPPAHTYVNIHPRCLHLWSPVEGDPPLPEFSGVRSMGGRTI